MSDRSCSKNFVLFSREYISLNDNDGDGTSGNHINPGELLTGFPSHGVCATGSS